MTNPFSPAKTHTARTTSPVSVLLTAAVLAALTLVLGCERVAVPTYHYDNLRTGWNSHERHLRPSNVNPATMEFLALALDDANDQVDTQPLIVPRVHIAGGRHDVVYVATENNSIYAVDADTDTKLLKVNLGSPVPWPIGCGNNGPTVGIDGTPAIDLDTHTMYAIAYILDSNNGNQPEYYLHALDLSTLAEKTPPRLVTANHALSNNNPFPFQARFQRQRPGLLLAHGNIYAGFGSFCDWGQVSGGSSQPGPHSRGWILGWQQGSLTPLAANDLNNTQTSEPFNMFLSSVWESGYGIAGDPAGDVFFTTGNSDPSGTTYDGCTNIQESVVKLPADLVRPCPATPPPLPFLFTPANVGPLDQADMDVGSAGVMALPHQPGPTPHLLVGNAKDGSMFLLNRDNLGGFTPSNTGALGGVQNIGVGAGFGCWCGPTYFDDGAPHVVSSGGGWTLGWGSGTTLNSLQLWNLQSSPPKLTQVATGTMPDTIQDPGFFTVVSSKKDKHAIIWAVSRPQVGASGVNAVPIVLYAFNATPSGGSLPQLFHAIAGSWSVHALGGNANIVPVVANGKVYVASYKELDIFGHYLPNGQNAASRTQALEHLVKLEFVKAAEEHQIAGTVRKVEGVHFALETRDHKMVEVDATKARDSFRFPVIAVGNGVVASGSYDAKRVLEAGTVFRSKANPATWPPDH